MDGPANAVANAGVTFAVFLFLSHANVEETAAVSEARLPAHLWNVLGPSVKFRSRV